MVGFVVANASVATFIRMIAAAPRSTARLFARPSFAFDVEWLEFTKHVFSLARGSVNAH
jgi:hypothetical protein